jgi:hypothetical protein
MSETREQIVEQILKEHVFSGETLDEGTSSEISRVLKYQFTEMDIGEAGGPFFLEDDVSLRMEVTESDYARELKGSLGRFRDGDCNNLDPLIRFMEEVSKTQAGYLGPDNADTLIADGIIQVLNLVAVKKSVLGAEKRDGITNMCTKIISNFFPFTAEDLLYLEKSNGLGLFHIHKYGQPPSGGDITFNKDTGIPLMLISARSDYMDTGVNLYLVSSGKPGSVYTGRL